MKRTTLIAAITIGLSALALNAEEPRPQANQQTPRRERGEFMRPPPPPLITALDANQDGVIDETEIANATAALKSLDENNDGKLSMEEIRPPRPDGPPPGGGPGRMGFDGPREGRDGRDGSGPRGERRDGPPGPGGHRESGGGDRCRCGGQR